MKTNIIADPTVVDIKNKDKYTIVSNNEALVDGFKTPEIKIIQTNGKVLMILAIESIDETNGISIVKKLSK